MYSNLFLFSSSLPTKEPFYSFFFLFCLYYHEILKTTDLLCICSCTVTLCRATNHFKANNLLPPKQNFAPVGEILNTHTLWKSMFHREHALKIKLGLNMLLGIGGSQSILDMLINSFL